MKKTIWIVICALALLATFAIAGESRCGSCCGSETGQDKKAAAENQKYTCEMHPEVVADKPGKCPKCGMNLVPKKDAH